MHDKAQTVPIELRSNPDGASVYFDGKLVGTSPASLRTHTGIHHVVYERAGFQSVQQVIEVTGDGHVVVKETSASK